MADQRKQGGLIWDLPLRIFHWALLISVVVSLVAAEVLDDIDLHLQSGQVVLGLLVFRLIWGIIGPPSAQFHRFIRSPKTVIAYLKGEPVSYQGHNPLGALSVVGLLAVLIIQVVSGLGADDEIFTTGPLAQFLTGEQIEWATSVHHLNHRVLYLLILLHVGAIAFYWFRRKNNLVKPMLTGHSAAQTPIKPRPLWLAVIAIAVATVVAVAIFRL